MKNIPKSWLFFSLTMLLLCLSFSYFLPHYGLSRLGVAIIFNIAKLKFSCIVCFRQERSGVPVSQFGTVNIFCQCFNILRLKDSTRHADRMTKSHKSSADTFIRISSSISQMGTSEYMDIARFFNKVRLFYWSWLF